MELYENTLDSKTIFKGKVVELSVDKVSLPDGSAATREVIHHPGGVCVVAIVDGEIVLVEQYRYAYGKLLLELPAGKLEPGEDAVTAGIRELEEETGLKAESLELLCTMAPTPAYCSEKIWIYMAKDITKTAQRLDSGEFLTLRRLPFSECVDMAFTERIEDAKTRIGIIMAAKKLGML